MQKPIYKLKEENKENPRLSLIEVSNLKDTITFQEVLENVNKLEKLVTELDGKLKLEQAKMTNITDNHASIKDLLPNKKDSKKEKDAKEIYLIAVNMYVTSREIVKEHSEMVEKCKKAIEQEKENLVIMQEATGIKYEG